MKANLMAYFAYAFFLLATLHLVNFETAVVIGIASLMAKGVER